MLFSLNFARLPTDNTMAKRNRTKGQEKVDLYSGSDSDATSNNIVAMEKRYYCEIIAFLSRRYYRF